MGVLIFERSRSKSSTSIPFALESRFELPTSKNAVGHKKGGKMKTNEISSEKNKI